jgi:hypothetical protein
VTREAHQTLAVVRRRYRNRKPEAAVAEAIGWARQAEVPWSAIGVAISMSGAAARERYSWGDDEDDLDQG